MKHEPVNRKEFIAGLGKLGVGTCLCAAAASMHAALGGQEATAKPAEKPAPPAAVPETKPGDKTIERAAKRIEFADGWLSRLFGVMDRTLDETSRKRLMEANGKACFAAFAGPAKSQPGPDALDRFLKMISREGAKRGYSVEGNVISVEFADSAETGQASPERICLCPIAEAQTRETISPTFCLCSVGYVKEMHERILGRPVSVELVESVLRGGDRCKFRMTVA